MDIVDKIKNFLNEPEPNITQGAPDAYDKAIALTDDQLRKFYLGKAPFDPKTREVLVPKEVQEELYKRFVAPNAKYNCSHCYGRGWSSWNPAINQVEPCMCLQRVIRDETAKENQKIILMN